MTNFRLSALLFSAMLIFAACGKKNQSGGSGNPYSMIGNNYNLVGGNGVVSLAHFGIVQCTTGMYGGVQQRTSIQQISGSGTVAVNSMYVGVTLEGDLAFLTSNNGQPVFTAYICMRPNMTGNQGASIQGVVPNRSLAGCPFDELVATVDVAGYRLAFFPLHLSQYRGQVGCRY